MLKKPSPQHFKDIEEYFLRIWDERLNYNGVSEIWFHAVTIYLQKQKYEIIPNEIREAEDMLNRRGLTKEYLASLLDGMEGVTHEEQMLYLIQASAEDRREAILKVCSAIPELWIQLPKYLTQSR